MAKEAQVPELVTVNCNPPVTINGKEYSGHVKVTPDVAEVLVEMVSKKRAADLAPLVGREYLVNRMLDGQLVIQDSHTKQRV